MRMLGAEEADPLANDALGVASDSQAITLSVQSVQRRGLGGRGELDRPVLLLHHVGDDPAMVTARAAKAVWQFDRKTHQ